MSEEKVSKAVIAPLYLCIEGKGTFYSYVMNVRFQDEKQLKLRLQDENQSFENSGVDTMYTGLDACLPDDYFVMDDEPYILGGFFEDDGETSFLLDIGAQSNTNKIDYNATKISETDFLKDAKLLNDMIVNK